MAIKRRSAYTLIELVVSMAAASVLLGGLASSLFLIIEVFDEQPVEFTNSQIAKVHADMMRDLERATAFLQMETAIVEFTVPDETGDGVEETIQYEYDNNNDQLLFTFNGQTTTLLANVASADFAFLEREVTGSSPAPVPFDENDWGKRWGSVLLMVTAGNNPNSEETARKSQFESWGYTVNTIRASNSQATYNTAMAEADVVYVPEDVVSGDVSYKLRAATIGVLHEERYLDEEMGFATSQAIEDSGTEISVVDNSHPITSGLPLGKLTITTSSQPLARTNGTQAAGAQQLATNSGTSALVVLEVGATLANNYSGNSTAAGRRVRMPWGGNDFTWSSLNSNGLLIAQRAIEWASQ